MILFHQFRFQGDLFFEKPTILPLSTAGLTYLRGVNHDGTVAGAAGSEGNELSNGAGKTRLFQLLEAFIYGKNDRTINFKKFVSPQFEGTLDFENTATGVRWNWKFEIENGWTVHRNGELHFISHQATAVQAALQKEIGLTREEWCHYLYICHDSLRILIAGKPKERRDYLEGFFSIDSFYQEKYDEAYGQLLNLQIDLDAKNADRSRLRQLEDILESASGEKWLKHQLWAADSAVQLLRSKGKTASEALAFSRRQQQDWMDFLKMQAVDPNSAEQLKAARDTLIGELDQLQQRQKQQTELKQWTNTVLREHSMSSPKVVPEPLEPRPKTDLLLELSALLGQMREKTQVRSELVSVTGRFRQAGADAEDLDRTVLNQRTESLQEEIATYKHRVDLVSQLASYSDGICPTCHQSVTDALHQAAKGHPLDELKTSLHASRNQLVECRKQEARLNEYEACKRERSSIEERYSKFPVFGETLAAVEDRYEKMKSAVDDWIDYDKSVAKLSEWETRSKVLRERFDALGGKGFIAEDLTTPVTEKRAILQSLNTELEELRHYFSLYERIKTYPSLKELQQGCQDHEDAIQFFEGELQHLYAAIASWRVELTDLEAQQLEAADLRERIQDFEEVQERYQVGKTRCDFYSPKGFKLFELKTKCKEFVEKCNYWSKIFFQEPYEWSVSEDLDNLAFYVKPAKGTTEPYPISSLSNGEKNRASRVLLFSQLEMIPRAKRTNLLVLDEVEAFLDQAGARAYIYHVLETLKTTFPQYSIIVISHLSALVNSGHIDHLWVVERKKRKSKLKTFPFFTKTKFSKPEVETSQQGELA